MPARQNIILGDRIPRIISICVCVVAIFPLLTADYLQRHYVISCGVSGSPFLIQHIGKVRNVECHLEFAATVFQHEDILRCRSTRFSHGAELELRMAYAPRCFFA